MNAKNTKTQVYLGQKNDQIHNKSIREDNFKTAALDGEDDLRPMEDREVDDGEVVEVPKDANESKTKPKFEGGDLKSKSGERTKTEVEEADDDIIEVWP